MFQGQRESCVLKLSTVLLLFPKFKLFQSMVVLGGKEYLQTAVFVGPILELVELFHAWSVTIFVVLKSVGFLGLISLLAFMGVKNSFAGIAVSLSISRPVC